MKNVLELHGLLKGKSGGGVTEPTIVPIKCFLKETEWFVTTGNLVKV